MKKTFIILTLSLLCVSCAKRVIPSGGEGDKIAPKIVEVFPSDKSLNVKENAKISITFSEWVTPKSVETGIIISPQTEFSLNVRARTVVISPKNPLKSNATYHISFLNDINDFSNNALVETQTIIFSTGGFLDTSFINGKIFYEKTDSILPKAALFFDERLSEKGDGVLFSKPDYITQADSMGNFTFENIAQSKYRLIAFFDKKRTNKITLGDVVFIGEEKIAQTQNFYELFPATCDTVQKKLNGASAISPIAVLVKSDETIYDSLKIYCESDNKNIRIEKIEKIEKVEKTEKKEKSDVTMAIFLEDSLQNKLYVLATQSQKIFITKDGDSIFYDTTKFNGTTLADTAKLAQLDSLLLPKIEEKIENDSAKTDSVKSEVAVFCPKLSWNFFGELPQNPLWEIKGEKSFLRLTNDNFLENVPVGKYTISLIDDKNQNKKHDFGTLFPFSVGEKKISFPDTLTTRERWEVEFDIGGENR
ncbi:MAG: Ig-like domain-containing domain [Chitinivibrionia bacterium]|nr:Ig-like domain-containing domain [Chitinivibrionia bacterium]